MLASTVAMVVVAPVGLGVVTVVDVSVGLGDVKGRVVVASVGLGVVSVIGLVGEALSMESSTLEASLSLDFSTIGGSSMELSSVEGVSSENKDDSPLLLLSSSLDFNKSVQETRSNVSLA